VEDYYTAPLRSTTVEVLAQNERAAVPGGEKAWGELQVTTQVTGFRKLRWYSNEHLGEEPLDLPPADLQTTGYWIAVSPETVQALSRDGLWTNAPNDYGPGWDKLRESIRARDGYRCQMCGKAEDGRQHDVHHKMPFRMFVRSGSGDPAQLAELREQANRPSNLVTLCPACHKKAETNVRVRSGLAGLAYALGGLAPLFLMCDSGDLGSHVEPLETPGFGGPAVVLYDLVPAGIGFSQKLYELHSDLVKRARELVSECSCEDGCPSCVGPGGENGLGGKVETLAILKELGR
jgi:DEAD/DEAH box helicase domain-containing protein